MSKITLPPNKDNFIFFSRNINTFYSLSYLVIGKHFNVILNRNGKSAHPCLAPHNKGNMFNISSLAMMFSLDTSYQIEGIFPGGSDSKQSACNAGDRIWSLGWEDLMEKASATHSSIMAWRIP